MTRTKSDNFISSQGDIRTKLIRIGAWLTTNWNIFHGICFPSIFSNFSYFPPSPHHSTFRNFVPSFNFFATLLVPQMVANLSWKNGSSIFLTSKKRVISEKCTLALYAGCCISNKCYGALISVLQCYSIR